MGFESTIRFEHVEKKKKDVTILEDITCEFNLGINLVLGSNGAGKTTLFHLLAKVSNPTKGNIVYSPILKPAVFTPASIPMHPRRNVYEHLKIYSSYTGDEK